MLRTWTHKILDRMLYCRECRAITLHDVLAKEPFSVHCAVRPGIPLVCRCSACKSFFVAFSHELYFGHPTEKDEYAKLLGQNRLAVNDWVYIDGKDSPGRVKALYTTQTEDVVVLNFGGGREEKFSRPLMTGFNEKAPFGFRLIPAQCGVALLGDPVYHVLRKAFGWVVGSVSDRREEKLVVRLENGKILFITLPAEKQLLPDDVLSERLSEVLKTRASESPSLKGQAIHAVAYLKGTEKRFPDKKKLLRDVGQMREFRGVVDLVRVEPVETVSDETIRSRIIEILDGENSPFFHHSVTVRDGVATVEALYFEGNGPEKFEARIGEIPGIRGLCLELEMAPPPSDSIKNAAARLSENLLANAYFAKCRFRVIPLADEILVKCESVNPIRKHLFNLAVNHAMKGENVPVHLCAENG